ncbi:hypothetical protein BC832DRAFT_560788 [Gaertneriomyces semiglobifer]|nr:hypothetical protein BC832DRAFT_560788 [Gaertneriomyces semiglobifer]
MNNPSSLGLTTLVLAIAVVYTLHCYAANSRKQRRQSIETSACSAGGAGNVDSKARVSVGSLRSRDGWKHENRRIEIEMEPVDAVSITPDKDALNIANDTGIRNLGSAVETAPQDTVMCQTDMDQCTETRQSPAENTACSKHDDEHKHVALALPLHSEFRNLSNGMDAAEPIARAVENDEAGSSCIAGNILTIDTAKDNCHTEETRTVVPTQDERAENPRNSRPSSPTTSEADVISVAQSDSPVERDEHLRPSTSPQLHTQQSKPKQSYAIPKPPAIPLPTLVRQPTEKSKATLSALSALEDHRHRLSSLPTVPTDLPVASDLGLADLRKLEQLEMEREKKFKCRETEDEETGRAVDLEKFEVLEKERMEKRRTRVNEGLLGEGLVSTGTESGKVRRLSGFFDLGKAVSFTDGMEEPGR